MMDRGTVHIVGAGLAGLAAAVRLADAGQSVVLHEASAWAGGRCRSYRDPELGIEIDNGNHLLLSGNTAALDFLARIGATDKLTGPGRAELPYVDLETGERWTLAMDRPSLAAAILSKSKRVPGTTAGDYFEIARLAFLQGDRALGDMLDTSRPSFQRLWHPIVVAALNTEPEQCSARLLWQVLRQSVLRGEAMCRPLVAKEGLGAAFVEPALRVLGGRGVPIRFKSRVREIAFDHDRVTGLTIPGEHIHIGVKDSVILATPPWVAAELVPDVPAPREFRAILNAHYRVDPPPGTPPLLGLLGGIAEWVFRLPGRLSVTVSAADRLIDRDRADLAASLWRDVARVLDMQSEPLPPWQIVKEKRATFAAVPHEIARRPQTPTRWRNLFLAGDWTQTHLPATIEGAIRSGYTAAAAIGPTERPL